MQLNLTYFCEIKAYGIQMPVAIADLFHFPPPFCRLEPAGVSMSIGLSSQQKDEVAIVEEE